MAKITVLGSGGWGAALAVMAQRFGHNVTLWSPFQQEIDEIRERIEFGAEFGAGLQEPGHAPVHAVAQAGD